MRRNGSRWFVALALILAPGAAFAQFEGLRFVDVPPVGSWAEYQLTRRNESTRVVMSQKVALLSRVPVEGGEIYWFQIEMESDDFGSKRIPIISQIALDKDDAVSRKEYFRKTREMIVQVGDAPAFRIAKDFLNVGVNKNMITGGSKGAGSDVEYTFRDLEAETLKTKAGDFVCQHKKGLGKAEVVLSLTNPTPERFPVDAIYEIWYSDKVPFGVVKQVTKQTGTGVQGQNVSARIDTEETLELVAYGGGARSAVRGAVADYNPAAALQFRPAEPTPTP